MGSGGGHGCGMSDCGQVFRWQRLCFACCVWNFKSFGAYLFLFDCMIFKRL